jgi:hypothetical protein
MRRLRDTEIVKLIFPAFDEEKRLLPKDAETCTGAALLKDAALLGGRPTRGNWPWTDQDGDLLFGSGGDRIKVAWLRVLSFDDGTVGGPLAIVRGTERFAELFATGPLRGHSDRMNLGTQRMGPEVLVTAEEDGCTGRQPGEPCENIMSLFLPRAGALRHVIDVPVVRIAYAAQGERGAEGALEYRLATTADYTKDGVHLTEQVRILDQTSGNELRVLERERTYVLNESGSMTTNEQPLWDTAVKLKVEKPNTPGAHPRRRP